MYAAGNQLYGYRWNDAQPGWVAAAAPQPAGGDVRFLLHRMRAGTGQHSVTAYSRSNNGVEELALVVTDLGLPTLVSSFTGVTAQPDKRWFDLETLPGGGFVLARAEQGQPAPRVVDFSATGEGTEAAIPLGATMGGANTATPTWLELAVKPGTSDLALAWGDNTGVLVVALRIGGTWQAPRRLTAILKRNAVSMELSNRSFDVAWADSTTAVVTWGMQGTAGYHTAWLSPGTINSVQRNTALSTGEAHFVDLAAGPGGRVAMGAYDLGDGVERLGVGTWQAGVFSAEVQVDSQLRQFNDASRGDMPGALAWMTGTDRAVAIYADDETGRFSWADFTVERGSWEPRNDVMVSGMNAVESAELVPWPDFVDLMFMVLDADGELRSFQFDGTTWTPRTPAGGFPGVLGTASVPFSVHIKE